MNRTNRCHLRLFAIAIAVSCAGCGPFGYLKKTARDASRAVADAERVDAEELAPYEYWGSRAYLEQSKVMMGYSEYERSFDYGDRAKQLAEEAKLKAERREAAGASPQGAASADDDAGQEAAEEATGPAAGEGDAEESGPPPDKGKTKGKAKGKANASVDVGGDAS